MSQYYSSSGRKKSNGLRLMLVVILGIFVIAGTTAMVKMISGKSAPVLSTSNKKAASAAGKSTVPWDYKVEGAVVGDLIGADMTVGTDNHLLPNDQNYATGDKVWVLSYMTAEVNTGDDGQNSVSLSSWSPLKSYRTEQAAQEDLSSLKVQLKANVNLVGVYKTEFNGKFRQFAVLSLPSGHNIKQPVTEERYQALKDKEQVQVMLEEVHDFGDYDLAMSKFRGWAD